MKPFEPGKIDREHLDPLAIKRQSPGMTMEEAHRQATMARKEKIFLNDRYQVHVRNYLFNDALPMKHLSIKRRDKEVIHDWRELQQIKNMLVGPECEGFELYPAESRLTDEANQYHLWVFVDPEIRIPVGNRERQVQEPVPSAGWKQRAFDEPLQEFVSPDVQSGPREE